ncbi:hypothetical protein NHG33_03215 [Aerococcaceae bacterium NML130460]|nr:hypothetical protein [Aerococcaceae bacterium NML130460]
MTKKNIMNNIFFWNALIVSVICLMFEADYHANMKWLFLLPTTYTLCIGLSKKNKLLMKSPGMMMFNIVIFVRFCITPLTMVLGNSLNIYARNYDFLLEATLMMCLELICMFGVIWLSANKFLTSNALDYRISHTLKLNRNYLLIILIIALGMFLVYQESELLGSLDILTKGVTQNNIAHTPSNLIRWIWRTLLAFVMIYAVGRIKSSGQKESRKVMYSLLVCFAYLVLIYIGQTSIARWYLVVSTVAIYFTLIDNYPTYKKRLSLSIIAPVFLIIVSASIIKNTNLSEEYSLMSATGSLFTPTNMDAYFAGPVGVNNAIGMIGSSNVSILNIYEDLLNNFPGISGMVDKAQVTNRIYNGFIFGYVSRNDQILPLVGQSAALFSTVLAPLLSMLSVFFVLYFDDKYRKNIDARKYCYAFTAVWFSLATILNMTIIFSWVYIVIIPLYTLLTVYNKTSFQRDS